MSNVKQSIISEVLFKIGLMTES